MTFVEQVKFSAYLLEPTKEWWMVTVRSGVTSDGAKVRLICDSLTKWIRYKVIDNQNEGLVIVAGWWSSNGDNMYNEYCEGVDRNQVVQLSGCESFRCKRKSLVFNMFDDRFWASEERAWAYTRRNSYRLYVVSVNEPVRYDHWALPAGSNKHDQVDCLSCISLLHDSRQLQIGTHVYTETVGHWTASDPTDTHDD